MTEKVAEQRFCSTFAINKTITTGRNEKKFI